MILTTRVAVLYDRCSSIEIKDFNQNTIKVKSIDSFIMSEVRFDSKEELKLAVVSAVLKIYLKDDVVITDELVRLFEENMQLGAVEVTYSGTLIMYSDIIVKVLYENGYKDGLQEDAIKFFYQTKKVKLIQNLKMSVKL